MCTRQLGLSFIFLGCMTPQDSQAQGPKMSPANPYTGSSMPTTRVQNPYTSATVPLRPVANPYHGNQMARPTIAAVASDRPMEPNPLMRPTSPASTGFQPYTGKRMMAMENSGPGFVPSNAPTVASNPYLTRQASPPRKFMPVAAVDNPYVGVAAPAPRNPYTGAAASSTPRTNAFTNQSMAVD